MSSSVTKEQLNALRDTPEYTAVFDLEVWRAEQRKKFMASLEMERQELRQQVEQEYAERDRLRVAELDEFRQELENMALGFKRSGEALQQRIQSLEKREAAFEARRLQVAREHEGILLASESKARQVREEMSLKVKLLQSKVEEKERVVQETMQRLSSVTAEYESLQSVLTRVQAQEVGRQAEVGKLSKQLHEASGLVEQARKEATEANKGRDEAVADANELRDASHHYKRQLKELAVQHNELLRQVSRERAKALEQEREALAKERQQAAAEAVRLQLDSHQQQGVPQPGGSPHSWAHEQVMNALQHGNASGQQEGIAGSASATATKPPAPGSSEIAALRKLMTELSEHAKEVDEEQRNHDRKGRSKRKGDDARGEDTRRSKRGKGTPSARRHDDYKMAYVPVQDTARNIAATQNVTPVAQPPSLTRYQTTPPAAATHKDLNDSRHTNTTAATPSPLSTPEKKKAAAKDQHNDHQDQEQDLSVSSLSEGEGEGKQQRQPKQPLATTDRKPQLPESTAVPVFNDDGLHNLSNELPPVTFGDEELYAHVSHTYPLPEPPSSSVGATVGTGSTGERERFVREPPEIPSPTRDRQQHQLSLSLPSEGTGENPSDGNDFRLFVERLRVRRDTLLESGVYTSEDTLIKEMERKMNLYEDFLRSH